MKIPFRQGIVRHSSAGTAQSFLTIAGGTVSLLATNSPVEISFAHQDENYFHSENIDITDAWKGIDTSVEHWLYIDIDIKTGLRIFGFTLILPVHNHLPPTKLEGQHWFDLTKNVMNVFIGGGWRPKIRVIVARITSAHLLRSFNGLDSIVDFSGSSVNLNDTENLSGKIVFDDDGYPIKRANGTLFTTEAQFFVNGSRVSGSRLESNVNIVTALETIPAFHVATYSEFGKVRLAKYEDTGNSVLGIVVEDLKIKETGSIILQGTVTNLHWNWSQVGKLLWVDITGQLVDVDPSVSNSVLHPKSRVPVARVLSANTVIFEQGLGGQGIPGPAGGGEVSNATQTELGIVLTTTPNHTVVSTDDPRLYEERPPLSHQHDAYQIIFRPYDTVISANVQLAIEYLETDKLSTSGGTVTGQLILTQYPTQPTQAATKEYVDQFINGLLWLDPIFHINLISDTVTDPSTISPAFSDVYFVPPGAVGVWGPQTSPVSAGLEGHYVEWDGSSWLDLGLINSIPNGARFGISVETETSASGTFLGKDNQIAILDDSLLQTWSFYIPMSGDAVFVNNEISLHAYHQYVFNGEVDNWIEFGGYQAIVAGPNLKFTGTELNVKDTTEGGTVDALTLSGQSATDFALEDHTHTASDILDLTNYIYDTIGTLFSTGTQSGIAVTYDSINNEISFVVAAPIIPLNNITDVTITDANTNDILAYDSGTWVNRSFTELGLATSTDVSDHTGDGSIHFTQAQIDHGSIGGLADDDHPQYLTEGRGDARYYTQTEVNDIIAAFAASDHTHDLPYDFSFFFFGNPKAGVILGSQIITNTVLIDGLGSVSLARSRLPTGTTVVYNIEHDGVVVGTVTFEPNVLVGIVFFPTPITLYANDILRIVTTNIVDDSIKDISITIVACSINWLAICPPAAGLVTPSNTQGYGTGYLLGGGSTSGYAPIEIYNFSNDSVAFGTSLELGRSNNSMAIGNNEFILLAGGSVENSTENTEIERYNFSNNTSTIDSLALTHTRDHGGVIGNGEIGLFAAGSSSVFTPTDTTDRITYATHSLLPSTILTNPYPTETDSFVVSAVGVSSAAAGYGLFTRLGPTGQGVSTAYTFATEVMTITANNGVGLNQTAIDNSVFAVITHARHFTYTSWDRMETYHFATRAYVLSSLFLGVGRKDSSGMSNQYNGIFAGGVITSSQSTAYVDKYIFTTNTISSPTYLNAPRGFMSGSSNAHGGL